MQNSYAAVILAGGQGKRMRNQDKGLLQYHEHRLITHVLKRLQAQLSNILIVANRNLAQYQQFGYPVISDWPEPKHALNYEGPLRGVCRAMQYFNAQSEKPEWLLLAPCDAPHYPVDLLKTYQNLLQRQSASEWDCLLPHDGERVQPLFALLRLSCLPQLEHALSLSELGLSRLLLHLNTWQITMPAEGFANINYPAQLNG